MKFEEIVKWLNGKKTYLVAAAGLIWGLYKGDVEIILAALALVGFRDALAKLAK
mgnify:FL=1